MTDDDAKALKATMSPHNGMVLMFLMSIAVCEADGEFDHARELSEARDTLEDTDKDWRLPTEHARAWLDACRMAAECAAFDDDNLSWWALIWEFK